MTSYQHQACLPKARKITVNADMSLNVPDQPDHPLHRGATASGVDITR